MKKWIFLFVTMNLVSFAAATFAARTSDFTSVGTPPGLVGKSPAGLEGRTPPGWSKGQKTGWSKTNMQKNKMKSKGFKSN